MKRRRLELPRHNCHYPLKVARLPIPPPLHFHYFHQYLTKIRLDVVFNKLSGKRDSDPRPRPWQGRALPTELFPPFILLQRSVPLNASAKVLLFSELPNFSAFFFTKNAHFAFFSWQNMHFLFSFSLFLYFFFDYTRLFLVHSHLVIFIVKLTQHF